MRTRPLLLLLPLGAVTLWSGDTRLGVGVFTFANQGLDLQASFRPTGSPWTFGVRHVQWMDTFRDPFTGRSLSETTETRSGPVVTYLFRPEARGSWYLGGAVYRWAKAEKSLVFGDTSRVSTTAPLVGGGYTGALGSHFYWNAGIFLGPGRTLKTQTSTGTEEDSGFFDLQAQAGLRF